MSYLAGSVQNIFLLSLAVQSVLPVLFYRLYRLVGTPTAALTASIVSTYFFINTTWWAPDFMIQPLMLSGFLVLVSKARKPGGKDWAWVFIIGLITGLVIVFKHNVGIFWGVLCSACLMFRSVDFSGRKRPFFLILISGFFSLGLIFLSKQIHADAAVYYLAPYFAFWGLVAYHIASDKAIGFDMRGFIKSLIPFSAASIMLPLAVFLWVGSAVGYARYFSSFGMGLQYKHLWDYGIGGLLRVYTKFQPLTFPKAVYLNYYELTEALIFFVPFLVNCLSVFSFFRLLKGGADRQKVFEHSIITSAGVIGTFMLYPLEAVHIAASKLFLYSFVLLYLVRPHGFRVPFALKTVFIGVFLIPVLLFAVAKPIVALKSETSYGSERVRKTMGLRMERPIAEALDEQLSVLERATEGRPYYVIDSSGSTLLTLSAFIDNGYPQYYMEQRKGILNSEVTDEIISALEKLPFAVVNKEDYDRYLSGKQEDPHMNRILEFIHGNYLEVGRYKPDVPPPTQIPGFLVMKKVER